MILNCLHHGCRQRMPNTWAKSLYSIMPKYYNEHCLRQYIGVILDSQARSCGQSRCESKQSLLFSHPIPASYTKISDGSRRKDGCLQHRRFSSWLLQLAIYQNVWDEPCQITASTEHDCVRRRDWPQEKRPHSSGSGWSSLAADRIRSDL